MRSCADTGISAQCDLLSLRNGLSRRNQHLTQMSVPCLSAVRMIDIYHISVSASPAGLCHRTAARCIYCRSCRRCPVYTFVISACSLCRPVTVSKVRGQSASGDRLNIGRRDLGSALYNLRNCFICDLLFDDLFGNLFIVFKRYHRYHLTVSCRRLLMYLGLCRIPFIIINIDHVCLVIFFVIHFLVSQYGKHRLLYRHDQLIIRTDHGVFIL